MSWRRPLALFLALLLLVSSSGVATLCIEADGSTRVELLAALCCDRTPAPPSTPTDGAEVSQVPTCAGCDDRPLEEGRWSRSSGAQGALTLALTPVPVATLLPALDRERSFVDLDRFEHGPPAPRSERPSLLRC